MCLGIVPAASRVPAGGGTVTTCGNPQLGMIGSVAATVTQKGVVLSHNQYTGLLSLTTQFGADINKICTF